MTDLAIYRLLTTGSRTWAGILAELRVQTVLSQFLALSDTLGASLLVVHGDCPKGADAAVRRWCDRRGVHQERWPADWREMLDSGIYSSCVGFLRDDSPGTRHCLQEARIAKIPTFVIPWETAEVPVVTYP